MKKVERGYVLNAGGILNGCPVVLVRRNLGGYTVRLEEDRGAYKRGDKVAVGAGEFSPSRRLEEK